jgi:hypothetical protein
VNIRKKAVEEFAKIALANGKYWCRIKYIGEGKAAEVVINIKHKSEIWWRKVTLRKVLDNIGLAYEWQNKQGRKLTAIWQNIPLQCNEIQQQTNSVSVREKRYFFACWEQKRGGKMGEYYTALM